MDNFGIILMFVNLVLAFVSGWTFAEARHLNKSSKLLKKLRDDIGKEGWNPEIADAQLEIIQELTIK